MAQSDLSDAFGGLALLLKSGSGPAVKAAQDAAAKVYVRAAKAAAPRDSGQLEQSITVSRVLDPGYSAEVGQRDNVRVGPSQRRGYYGYFIEKGHRTAGPHRVNRDTGRAAHRQRGAEVRRSIPARPWFEPAIESAHGEALKAAEAAFYRVMKAKDN